MPLYEYKCENGCGNFDAWKPIADRDHSIPCPKCHQSARRIFSPPMLLSGSLRLKHENPEPVVIKRTDPPQAPQLKSPAGRPWMVTH